MTYHAKVGVSPAIDRIQATPQVSRHKIRLAAEAVCGDGANLFGTRVRARSLPHFVDAIVEQLLIELHGISLDKQWRARLSGRSALQQRRGAAKRNKAWTETVAAVYAHLGLTRHHTFTEAEKKG